MGMDLPSSDGVINDGTKDIAESDEECCDFCTQRDGVYQYD